MDEKLEKLFAAIKEGNLKKVQAAIKSGANVNGAGDEKRTPLHAAVTNPDHSREIVDALIEAGADVDAKDADHRKPEELRSVWDKEVEELITSSRYDPTTVQSEKHGSLESALKAAAAAKKEQALEADIRAISTKKKARSLGKLIKGAANTVSRGATKAKTAAAKRLSGAGKTSKDNPYERNPYGS